MIAPLLCVLAVSVADGPSLESIARADATERPALIEARLAADRSAMASAADERDRAIAALALDRSLLTLAWSRSLAPERVLLGTATEAERSTVARLAREMLQANEALLGPGSSNRALMPYRASALTLLAALEEAAPSDAQAAWQGIPLRRAHPRLLRLAAWAADASGDLRSGSDRHSMLVKQGEITERWLAQLSKRKMLGSGQWPTPDAPWQVLLLAEARAHDAADVAASEALLADALPRLVAVGWSADEAAAVLSDRMAAMPSSRALPFAGTALARASHAAAMVTRGEIDAWSDAPGVGAAAPWARVAARRAARAFEARGDTPAAMAAWAGAGEAGDALAARRAGAWVLALPRSFDDAGVIDRLRSIQLPEVALVAEGVHARRAGRIDDAIRSWVRVPAGSSLQVAALAAAAAHLRHVDLDALSPMVQRLRSAAAAAMTDTSDPDRVDMARLASGWALAALVDHALDEHRLDQAAEFLERDPARSHLSIDDALRLAARVALRRGDATDAMQALADHDPTMARDLLLERALAVMGPGRGVAPEPAAVDPRGLRAVIPLMLQHLDTDELQHRMLLADALRLDGRGEPDRYRALLADHPDLADAMFGLAELLLVSKDERRRSEAMALYRGLVGASVESAPDRWWLSQLRMLQLAKWAGRPPGELRARVERLRHAAPDLGGRVWSGPIQAAVQSSN